MTLRNLATPARRVSLYLILAAAVPIASVYGLVNDTTGPLWLALASAMLGYPLAAANVPHAPDARGEHAL